MFGAIAEAVVLGVTDAFIWPKPTLAIYTPITFRQGAVSTARFSPDGKNIIYSASWEGRPYNVFFGHEGSPDARTLGFDSLQDAARAGGIPG